ncbi:hypothetical protein V500_10722 [Pseudogymnoascus sp. VKM F-4518 (FW-2643)]|nr:hypothetical protein V500_10722 [Pseudogymnoascus sp. VKM F-4518 (FW-2643)]
MDTTKVKLPQKNRNKSRVLHGHREVESAPTPREGAEQSDGSEVHQQCWRSREVPKSRTKPPVKTGSREGASNKPKPRPQLGDRSGDKTSDDLPEASSNRGHRRRDTEP